MECAARRVNRVPGRLLGTRSVSPTAICRSRGLWTSDSLNIESTADKTRIDRPVMVDRNPMPRIPRINFLFLTNGDRPASLLENGQHYTWFFPRPCWNTHPSFTHMQKTDSPRWNRIFFLRFPYTARGGGDVFLNLCLFGIQAMCLFTMSFIVNDNTNFWMLVK